jgi:hypothetical protein
LEIQVKQTVDYNVLAASAPINAQAARDVSPERNGYAPNKRFGGDHWDAPPETIRIPWKLESLVGLKVGRLVVTGLLDAKNLKGKGAKWLCRCLCGNYTSRRAKALKNPANDGDRCDLCRHNVFLQREQFYLRNGKDKHIREFLKD